MKVRTRINSVSTMRCRTAFVCLGYGAYLAFFPIGPVGASYLSHLSGNWALVLAAQAVFLAFTGLSSIACRHVDFSAHPTLISSIAFGATLLGLGLTYVAAPQIPFLVIAGIAVMGASSSIPKVIWYREFLALYRTQGRIRCIELIGGCFVVGAALSLATAPLRTSAAASCVVIAALIATEWALQTVLLHNGASAEEPDCVEAQGATGYHSTPYSRAVLISFGITWTLIYSCLVDIAFAQNRIGSVQMGIIAGTAAFYGIIVFVRIVKHRFNQAHFGSLVRWAIVSAGCACSSIPLLASALPTISSLVLTAAFVFQSTVMILFSIDLCAEQGLPMRLVFPINYGTFVLASCVTTVIYWVVVKHLDLVPCFETVAFMATLASLGVIPFLPSTTSRASSFTFDRLPENESYEHRMNNNFALLATKCRLSDREREIARLMIDGKSREEIAAELSLSPWTVKTHVAAAYKKMGIHSLRELTAIVSGASEAPAG